MARRIAICAALAVLAAGCGDESAQVDRPSVRVAEDGRDRGPLLGGGGAAPVPVSRDVEEELNTACKGTRERLSKLPEPGEDLGIVAANAREEARRLERFARRLETVSVDDSRQEALERYRTLLRRQAAVDRLLRGAARAGDGDAVDALERQKTINRRGRRELIVALAARECRPGQSVTD